MTDAGAVPDAASESEALALRRIRGRRGWGLAWVLASPFLLLVFGDALRPVMQLAVIGWGATVCLAALPAGFSRCPRCRRFFFLGEKGRGLLSSRCSHCDLPLKPAA